MIDTHAHLDFKEFDGDRKEVISRAYCSGVKKIINVGCDLKTSKLTLKLVRQVNLKEKNKENILYAAVGIHPHEIKNYNLKEAIVELGKLAKNKEVVAIGECGLDYWKIKNEEEKIQQKNFFEQQLILAERLNLPVIIHSRNAFDDLLLILKRRGYPKKKVNAGVVHCFSGNRHVAQKLIALGFLISFTGIITYVKDDDELLKVVKDIPLSKIMIETDSPFLAPIPFRGKRNEPLYVKYVAKKIAEIRKINLQDVEKQTDKNAYRLFGLDKF